MNLKFTRAKLDEVRTGVLTALSSARARPYPKKCAEKITSTGLAALDAIAARIGEHNPGRHEDAMDIPANFAARMGRGTKYQLKYITSNHIVYSMAPSKSPTNLIT
jgi:hypothetical protein